ncbi:PepSY-associated TM helix domain-containing protein [Helicobacter kayseriensis]|uniref:PepSY-associated TM helix domain-containing protein n=1 Tax=Helicobacter kayseriensis TaxID=2905877 RepID=UPI001E2ADA9F|nr:PepSY-associated TM helix domain-containing protein [Helicobacter kayseriensis]MCE3047621.1 PepSY-associated TM helix domain-containing protein [Helicobacter kayseriensis]MCE3049027.1 PepSY-associated TM helix domain-containing protein [Helicobacter kayseriensis]
MGKVFRTIHINLSLFFLPLALLYAVTGAFYLSGFNQDSGAKVWSFSSPMIPKSEIPNVINRWLSENHLKPILQTELKKGKNNTLIMGSASYSASIQSDKDGLKVEIIKRSLLGNLIMLHKGKAKWYFDVLAYGFAFSMLVFYFSGLVMTKFCNKRRKQALSVMFLGFFVACIVGYLSLQ